MISTSQLILIPEVDVCDDTLIVAVIQCPIIRDNFLFMIDDSRSMWWINVIIITAWAFICHKGSVNKNSLLICLCSEFFLLYNVGVFCKMFYCRAMITPLFIPHSVPDDQQNVSWMKWKNFSRELFPHLTSLSAREKKHF